jgi:hypothetical protein
MNRSKILEIINTFSADEMKAMSVFVKSPYFNTNKNLVKLYETIKKDLPHIKTGKVSEQEIFGKVFPGKPFNYGIMKNLTSAMSGLLEQFLLFNNIKNNPEKKFDNDLTLAREYDTRFLDSYFVRHMKKLRDEMNTAPVNADHYRNYTALEEQEYFFYSSRSDDVSLQNAVYYELVYSIADFFRKFSRSLWKVQINKGNINTQYNINFIRLLADNVNFQGMLEGMKQTDEKTYTNIKINMLLIKLLTDRFNTENYFEIKKLFIERNGMFENYEKFSIISKIISYCSVMFEEGMTGFLPESLVLQKLMLENVRFRYKGLGPYNFHNFVELAYKFIHVEQTEEAENLVKRYIGWLEDDKKQLAHDLIMALISIERNRSEAAIEYIKKIKPQDTFVKMFVRKIYIEAYYELGSYEQGFDMIASFKTFVREKNDLNDYTKNTHLNSLRIFEKLYKIKCSPEKYTIGDVNRLEKEIAENNFVNRKWQLGKIRVLKEIMK